MKKRLSISARLSELSVVREAVFDFIGDGLSDTEKGRVILAIDEAVSNVVVHGYNYDESKIIDIDMESDPASFTFIISDFAREFNPLNSDAPDIENYYEKGQDNGLGVDIYKRIMKVKYMCNAHGGNRLILIKEK
jgi:serine/threonine-protein kinase RsbW